MTRTPALDLKLPAANIDIEVEVPADRFVIMAGGPTLGPAVLFWPMVGAILILSYVLSRIKLTPLGVVSWFLLFIGLTQLSLGSAALVAGWLLALGHRGRGDGHKSWGLFNFWQFILLAWSIEALTIIYNGLKHGLLESPSMRVTGNSSTDTHLLWFQDRVDSIWPSTYAVTFSQNLYHYIMLAWAIWLAISMIRWLVWGWKCFSRSTYWKSPPRTRPSARSPKAPTEKVEPSPASPAEKVEPSPASPAEKVEPSPASPAGEPGPNP
jgi:hypothetical protein